MILKAQSKWGWLVAAYLFLAGLGAGAHVTGVVADFAGGPWAALSKIGICLGSPCVAIGCVFLLLDLGSPVHFWRAGFRPNSSWIARGTIIISIFMILGVIHIAFWIWPFNELVQAEATRRTLGVIGAIFGFGTMIYTGVLLAAARPIAFWSTAMLPLLFLVSALSTGMMAVIFVASVAGGAYAAPIGTLARIDLVLIVIEIIVLAFYLQGTHRVSESRASAQLVLLGDLAPLFWLGVGVLGLLAPLVLDLLHLPFVAAFCGMIGGLFLRKVVLSGGIHAPLRAGRFEIGLPIV